MSWESEKPSKSSNKVKNTILNVGYGAIDLSKKLSFGYAFPKPVLCVAVRKVREATFTMPMEQVLEPAAQVPATVRQKAEDRQSV